MQADCIRAWDGLSFGGLWNDCFRPEALPALALQALGWGAHGVWVQLCPPRRLGALGKEAQLWPLPVQKLLSQDPVGTLVLHVDFKSTAHISFEQLCLFLGIKQSHNIYYVLCP